MSVARTPRRLIGRLYRACAAPFGLRALDQMLQDGLPARLRSPLRFLFTGEAPTEAENVAARIERRRADIASRRAAYRFAHLPTPMGIVRWLESADGSSGGPRFSSRWLAEAVSVPRRWGMFLHLCAQAFDARAILELGAGVGISGAYLASIPSHPRFLTLEGSAALAPIAHETLAAMSSRASILHGPFETGIQRAFTAFADEHLPVDVAYIDGHHEEAASLHYVRSLVPHLANEALVIVDDIHLYAEMWRAWQRIRSMRGVAAALNVGRFGVLVCNGGASAAAQYDLARYTGWWRIGGSRPAW
jgi:predicted O-methyltransferase YrrM